MGRIFLSSKRHRLSFFVSFLTQVFASLHIPLLKSSLSDCFSSHTAVLRICQKATVSLSLLFCYSLFSCRVCVSVNVFFSFYCPLSHNC
ncbi:hypothetical protein BJ741DRAFT_627031 [Chytriomyces cf. hyalinus JEL632]|nr:hypothetical protein BJ741DRAFT_627031 [Chytriomyces cf. hyalinus JEL632]